MEKQREFNPFTQNKSFEKCKTYTTNLIKTGSTAATSNYTGAAY